MLQYKLNDINKKQMFCKNKPIKKSTINTFNISVLLIIFVL